MEFILKGVSLLESEASMRCVSPSENVLVCAFPNSPLGCSLFPVLQVTVHFYLEFLMSTFPSSLGRAAGGICPQICHFESGQILSVIFIGL
jgi:hypothetical protein